MPGSILSEKTNRGESNVDSRTAGTTGYSSPFVGDVAGSSADEDLLTLSYNLQQEGYRWQCLYTRPRHEKSLARTCERHGVRQYLPLVKTARHYGNRTRESWLPLFPGYLFCCANPAQSYDLSKEDNLLSTFAVYDQEKLLMELREVHKALAASARSRKAPYLAEGRRVRITQGPFRDIVGVVLESRKHCRVLLNVTLIRQSVLLEVDAENLELVP